MRSEADWQRIIIIGAGGHGSEISSYIRDMTEQGARICLVGFVDEQKPPGLWGRVEILGNFDDLREFLHLHQDSMFHYITAIGDNRIRRQFVQQVENLGAHNLVPWTLRHPHAIVGHEVETSVGTCLAPGSIITTRVHIGIHCILNVNASVSHDCRIGDFVSINPGAVICGHVKVGEGCYIGAGATIIDHVAIGQWTVIGAGAVVINDIPPHVTAVGVPARVIKHPTLPRF